MSNPFLADLEESYTPYSASGTTTPYSTGGATPKRRMSTNPFEILSPEDEGPNFNDGETNDQTNQVNHGGVDANNVANAIANMTADFYETIKMSYGNNEGDDDDVFKDNEEAVTSTAKTVNTVFETTDKGAGGQVFDPFETIHDDEGTVSSKRSSLEHTSVEIGATFRSAKAKDLFHSSMAEMEMLAATQTGADFSPASNDPGYLGAAAAASTTDVYTSDISELSDVSPANPSTESVAFQSKHIYSGKLCSCVLTRSSVILIVAFVDKDEVLAKVGGFDAFTTVITDSPTIDEVTTEEHQVGVIFALIKTKPNDQTSLA